MRDEHLPTRINRDALERIIARAAELQAAEHDIGEGLSEHDLIQLGKEVGIPDLYLQRALAEERVRDAAVPEQGLGQWLLGPRAVHAQRMVADAPKEAIAGLNHWMTDKELLTVKRRFQNATSWEAKKDFFSSVKRELGMGGRQYVLAGAEEITAQVVPAGDHSHIRLSADLDNTRRSHIQGAAAVAALGALATAAGIGVGVLAPVALVPALVGLLGGFIVMRRRRQRVERVQVGLEQVLDRLEHKELKPPESKQNEGFGTISRIASEIKKNLRA